MPKIFIIPKEKCRLKDKWQYILPNKVYKRDALGVFKYMREYKTKKPLISRRMTIYVAGGNGWITFITLIHEYMHFINARFFKNNDKFDKWIEKYL